MEAAFVAFAYDSLEALASPVSSLCLSPAPIKWNFMTEWESVEIDEAAEPNWEQMAEGLPTTMEERREVKGQGKVYYDRGGGWYFIGPLWQWQPGDFVELPSKDGVVVEVVKPATRWGEEDGMMEARIAEDYRI